MRFIGNNLDFFGFSASFLCALHCIAIPIVLSLGTLSGLAWLHTPVIEFSFTALAVIFAFWSLIGSYTKKHKNVIPLIVASLGFAFLISGIFLFHHEAHFISAIGGILIAYAHYFNWRLLHRHKLSV